MIRLFLALVLLALLPFMGLAQGTPVRLQFPNTDVKEVLHFYQQLTGKNVLYDNNVQGQISIVITREVTREEAIALIESSLTLNGFALVEGPDNTVKVIGVGKNPRAANVQLLTLPDQLPDSNMVVSYLYRLEYMGATDAQQALQSFVFPQPYTLIQPLERIRAVVITETSPVIRSCIALLASIDTPPAEVVSKFFELRSADAQTVVESLAQIFEADSSRTDRQPTSVRQRAGGPTPPNGGPAEGVPVSSPQGGTITISEDSIIIGKIKLTADERSNRIHVVTRPENMPLVTRLIEEFDSNVALAAPATRKLNYVSAGEILPVIVKAIEEPGIESEAPEGGSTTGGATDTGGGSSVAGGGGSSSGGGSISFSEQLRAREVDTKPLAATVGSTKIIADQRANAIIVLGTDEVKKKVFQLLDEIDVRAPQVVIATVVGEMRLDQNEELGFDYLINNQEEILQTGDTRLGGAGIGRNTSAPLLNPANLIDAGSFAANFANFPGLTAYVAVGDVLTAIVRALKSTGRFTVTSNPTLFTSNNKKAIIASGEEIAVPSQTVSTIDVTQPISSSSIQFKTVALQLEILPLVNPNGEVTLEILQKVDNTSGTTNISGNEIPNIATRFLRTTVTVKSGDTIALGGLIISEDEENVSGIPYLMDIPYVGTLFKTTRTVQDRRELVILMRPTVIESNAAAMEATRIERNRLELTKEPSFQEIEAGVAPIRRALEATPRDFESGPVAPVEGSYTR